jgi:hypothetical protein
MGIYTLLERCKQYFAPPLNFSGNNAIDEEKIYEAMGSLYEMLNDDDSMEGFIKWIVIPMVVVFGKSILSEAGLELLNGQQEKLNLLTTTYNSEKSRYISQKEITELEDQWDFIKFANRDVADVGKAFIQALKFKKIKL